MVQQIQEQHFTLIWVSW